MRLNPRGWSYDEVVRILEAFGFEKPGRTGGSHRTWRHASGDRVTLVDGGSGAMKPVYVIQAANAIGRVKQKENLMKSLEQYIRLPWTVQIEEHHDDGHYYAATIAELPGFVVAADTPDELDEQFVDALASHIESFLDNDEEPPVPQQIDFFLEVFGEEEVKTASQAWDFRDASAVCTL